MQVDVIESSGINADQLNREVLEAMLAMAENAPEPGTLKPQDVLHQGDEEVPAVMVASTLKSAGYTVVYHRFTGEPSLCNNNMVPAQMRKVDTNPRTGKIERVFDFHRPKGVTVARGTVRCVLHPERREPWMDAAGVKVCPKATLASEYEMQRHAQTRHKSEWQAITLRREELERKEEREERRASTAATQALLRLMLAREAGLNQGDAPLVSTEEWEAVKGQGEMAAPAPSTQAVARQAARAARLAMLATLREAEAAPSP